MVISTVLVGMVAIYRWRWSKPAVFAVFGVLGLIDLAFLASNALKVTQGGWLPLAVAATVFVVMDTWRVGRRVHLEKVREGSLALDLFLARADKMTQRVAGTAVFMSPRSDVVPGALLHSLKHYKVLHERIVLATVSSADTPFVPAARRITVEKLGKGFFTVRFVYGFFESPDIPEALAAARAQGLALEMDQSTFFLGRETLVPGGALYVAGVERTVARAVLSIAAGTRGRTRHAGDDITRGSFVRRVRRACSRANARSARRSCSDGQNLSR